MERRKPLQAKTGLARTGAPLRRTPMKSTGDALTTRAPMNRGTGKIRQRSAKMDKVYEQRRPLVAAMLAERPLCQACDLVTPLLQPIGFSSSGVIILNDAVDVHEMLTRSRSGNTAKAILDRENCLCVCRPCHTWIGDHPHIAELLGLVRHSWD